MYFLWGGLTVLYGISCIDTLLLQGDPGGVVMGLIALLLGYLTVRSWKKSRLRRQEKLLRKNG